MNISMIIDVVFFAFLVLSFLWGLWKGMYKSTFGLCFNLVLFLIIWIVLPAFSSLVVNIIPNEAKEELAEYMSNAEMKEALSGILRIFFSGIVWVILMIVLSPVKLLVRKIFRKIIFSGEKKPKTWASRFGGSAISVLNAFLIVLLVTTPFVGTLSTLRDEKGKTKCLVSDDFNSCDITKYYTNSSFSKVISVANMDKNVFKIMSNMNLYGKRVNLQNDLSAVFDTYLILESKGLSLGGEIDYIELLSKLSSEEFQTLGDKIASVDLLVVLMDNVGVKVIEKETNLPEGFDIAKINFAKEIENFFNIIGEIVKLPIFDGSEITDNYYNVIATLDSEYVDSLVSYIEKSDLLNELYDTYLIPKFEDVVNDFIKDMGGEKTVTLEVGESSLASELKTILNSISKIKDAGIITLNEENNEYELSEKGSKLLSKLNEEKTSELIDDLFGSTLISQVLGEVSETFILKYFNETLDKNYTSSDLNLGDVSWSSELKNVVSLAILLSNEGVIDEIENDTELLEAVLSVKKDVIELIGEKMGKSKVITSLVPEIVEPTLEDVLSSMMESGTVSLPDDINWSSEMKNLLVAAKLFYDGGAFEDDFDVNDYIVSLKVNSEKDEVEELSEAITSSQVFMAIFPDIIQSKIETIDSTINYDNIVWEDEIESLLRAYKLLASEGLFEDEADITEVMVDVLKEEENIDTLFQSEIIYTVVTNRINDELDSFEFDGEVLKGESTEGFTKTEWKNEINLLVKALDDQDAVDDFQELGKMDPSISSTSTRIEKLSVIVSSLLKTRTLGPTITNKVNELLEFEDEDKKTQSELTVGVNWNNELLAVNQLLWNITDEVNHETEKEVTVEMVPEFIESAKATVIVKELVSKKIKEGLKSLEKTDGSALLSETFINSLDIFDEDNNGDINWDKEVETKTNFEAINYPGETDYDNGVGKDGDKLTLAMSAAGETTIVKAIVEDTLLNEIKERVKPYFFEDENNPTAAENEDYENYLETLDIFNANYRNEFKVYDDLQDLDNIDTSNSSFGPTLDEFKVTLNNSSIFGPVANRQIKNRLKTLLTEIDLDNNPSTVTTANFIDDLDIVEISWTNELKVKDDLEDMLPFETFSIDSSNVNTLFGDDGLFVGLANSIIVTSMINENDLPDDKKIMIENETLYNLIIDKIDELSASSSGKNALKKIIYLSVE